MWAQHPFLGNQTSFSFRVLMSEKEIQKKVLILGCGLTGKTFLTWVLATGKYPEGPEPPLLQTVAVEANVNGETIHLSIVDVPGSEDYQGLANEDMKKADVVVLAFSFSYENSLTIVEETLYPAYLNNARATPAIVVGLKSDLKGKEEYENEKPVPEGKGSAFAESVGLEYYECSAKTKEGIDEFLAGLAKASLIPKKVFPKQSRISRVGAKFSSLLK